MIFPLLPDFLTRTLNAGPAALGLIEGVAEATASLMKMVSGWWSDRVPPPQAARRRRLLDRGRRAAARRPRGELGPGARHPLRRPRRQGHPHVAARRAARRHGAAGAPGTRLRPAARHGQRGRRGGPAARGLPPQVRLRGRALGLPARGDSRASRRSCSSSSGCERPRAASSRLRRALPRRRASCPRRLWVAIGIFVLFTLASSTDAFLLLRARDVGHRRSGSCRCCGRSSTP